VKNRYTEAQYYGRSRMMLDLLSDNLTTEGIKYLCVGGGGVLLNWIAFIFLRQCLQLSTIISVIIVHIILILYAFPLQKYFTFQNHGPIFRQFAKFAVNASWYITLDFFLSWAIIDVLGIMPVYGKAIGLGILTPLSFTLQKLWVFSKYSGSNLWN